MRDRRQIIVEPVLGYPLQSSGAMAVEGGAQGGGQIVQNGDHLAAGVIKMREALISGEVFGARRDPRQACRCGPQNVGVECIADKGRQAVQHGADIIGQKAIVRRDQTALTRIWTCGLRVGSQRARATDDRVKVGDIVVDNQDRHFFVSGMEQMWFDCRPPFRARPHRSSAVGLQISPGAHRHRTETVPDRLLPSRCEINSRS